MKVMYRFYDSSNFTILPQEFYECCTDSTILPILRFDLKSFMKVMYRFYDSSDSTILPQEFYESDVPILRFFRFYDFLQWMKRNEVYSWFLCTVITFYLFL